MAITVITSYSIHYTKLYDISQITEARVQDVSDYLKLGDVVRAKVLEVDRQGRVRLSIKEAVRDEQGDTAAPAAEAPTDSSAE